MGDRLEQKGTFPTMTIKPLFKGALIAAFVAATAAPFAMDASAAAPAQPAAKAPAKAAKTLKARKGRGGQQLFNLGNKSVGQALNPKKTRGESDWPATLVLVNKTEHTLFAAIKVRDEWIQIAHLTPYAKAEVRLPNAEFTVDAAYKDAQGQIKNFGPEVADLSDDNGPLTWNLAE